MATLTREQQTSLDAFWAGSASTTGPRHTITAGEPLPGRTDLYAVCPWYGVPGEFGEYDVVTGAHIAYPDTAMSTHTTLAAAKQQLRHLGDHQYGYIKPMTGK